MGITKLTFTSYRWFDLYVFISWINIYVNMLAFSSQRPRGYFGALHHWARNGTFTRGILDEIVHWIEKGIWGYFEVAVFSQVPISWQQMQCPVSEKPYVWLIELFLYVFEFCEYYSIFFPFFLCWFAQYVSLKTFRYSCTIYTNRIKHIWDILYVLGEQAQRIS